MFEIKDDTSARSISYSSSVADEGWHRQTEKGAFECWHFDALSDDGREALILDFNDNYPYSLRYFQGEDQATEKPSNRYPAVSFVYCVDGKVVASAVNEFRDGDLTIVNREYKIGGSSFRVDSMDYGSGYFVRIDLVSARRRRIRAELEWLSIESDLLHDQAGVYETGVVWNIVAPRSDVSGRIEILGRKGADRGTFHFRGTGYHDAYCSGRNISETIARCWGRAHFTDSTVVIRQLADESDRSHIIVVSEGKMLQHNAQVEIQSSSRNRFGIKVPARMLIVANDGVSVRIKPIRLIHSGFFEVKTLSEFTLTLTDGKRRTTKGICQFLAPERMNSYLFRRLADMQIGRNGKPALF